MAGDELFKRYLEIGASVLGMSRERAESIVRDLVASGEVAKGQATKAADWLVERGRAGTEELAEMVRREIRQQVTTLGLATKEDLARLEAELQEVRSAAANAATPTAAASATPRAKATGTHTAKATTPRAAKAAPGTRTAKAAAGTAAGDATPGTPGMATGTRKTAAGATKSAGISRSGSVRKRAGGSGAGAVRPAGGPVPPKG